MPVVLKNFNSMSAKFKDITGVILAGGKSSRFGRNKALVEFQGIRLIERVVRTLRPIFRHLILITNTPHEYGYIGLPAYEDLVKGIGPLGGIYTGLKVISDETGFFVACDMPFLNSELINHTIKIREGFDAVIPRINWKVEALHALYSRKCLSAIKEMIDSKEYQIIKFFNKINVRYIEEEEIRLIDPKLRSFYNINRPDEL